MRFLKSVIAALFFISIAACSAQADAADQPSGRDIREAYEGTRSDSIRSDMSGYETYKEDESYVFVNSNMKEIKGHIDNKETFVLYFGFSRCPYCRDFMPILNKVSNDLGVEYVYYINTREKPEWKLNSDIDDYDILLDLASDFLDDDEEGNKRLYVPLVLFVKNGEIVKAVDSQDYDAPDEKISEELAQATEEDIREAYSLWLS